MLKNKLLSTGYFVDNEYLSEYILLMTGISEAFYKEKHHILPRQYFKLANIPCDNSAQNLVNLSYADHCKAHYLLTFCTLGELRKGSLYTLNLMLNSPRAKFAELSLDEQEATKLYNDSNDLFWSACEHEILRKYYPTLGAACVKFLPNRTKKAVKSQAKLLGIRYDFEFSDRRRYTPEDDKFLIENYQKYGVKYCAKVLRRSEATIKSRAAKVLNIAKPAAKLWSEAEVAILRELYPKLGPSKLTEKLPNRKPIEIRKKAHRLGIKYDMHIKQQ